MARENINVGANKNDGTGEELRSAMQKINANFVELYERTGSDTGTTISIANNQLSATGDIIITTNQTGNVIISSPLSLTGNLTTTSNIGINTTTPDYDLDVLGNMRVSNNTILGTSFSTDSLTINAGIINSIIPKVNNQYDLGFDTLQFRNLYVGGTAFLTSTYTPNIITTGGSIDATGIGQSVPANGRFVQLAATDRIDVGDLIIRNQGIESKVINADISLTALGTGKVRIPTKLAVGVGGSTMSNPVVQIVGNSSGFNQVGVQNINSSKFSCSDFVIQADNGGDSYNFADMGINNSNWDGTLQHIYFDILSDAATWDVGDVVYQSSLIDSAIIAQGIIDESVVDPNNAAQWRIRVSQVYTGTTGQFDETGADYSNVYNTTKGNNAATTAFTTQTITSTGASEYTLDRDVFSSDSIRVKVDGVPQVTNVDYYTHVSKVIFTTEPTIGATIVITYYNDVNYPFAIGRSGDAYFYNNGGDLSIGTMSYGNIVFHTNGIRHRHEVGCISAAGNFVLGGHTAVDNGAKLQVTGNATVSGLLSTANLNVSGNLTVLGGMTTITSQDLIVEDSTINVHTQGNLAPWTFNDGFDVGFVLHYYDTSDKEAFFGLDNTTGTLKYLVDSTSSGGVYSGTDGNIQASTFISTAVGVAPFVVNSTTMVANLTVETANVANTAISSQTVTDSDQPNITSFGVLTNLSLLGRTIVSSTGSPGDTAGMIAVDNNYLYHCVGTYDGSTSIWKRVLFTESTW